jgi:DNA-binding response OmpR family regulator
MHAVTAAVLRAADPAAHRRHRIAAWACLRRELRDAPQSELWRYTADMLFLVDNAVVREFFFPTMVLDQSVRPARAGDWPAIAALGARDRHVSVEELEQWWRTAPEAFAVSHDGDGQVTGFRCLAEREQVSAALMRRDPLAARWREHLRRDPVPRGHRVLFLRYVVTRGEPMTPSTATAALLLDLKRTYVSMRPELRRAYAPETLLAGADGDCALVLGYAPLPGEQGLDRMERSLYNDYGPGSIDAWLADLAARELLVEETGAVDSVRRELRFDGERIDLTQLEFDVLRYLQQREGQAVQREALLRDVWGYEWTGGSNVIEVAISALRKKLGEHAGALRTVRGIGYRLDPLT